MNKSLDELEGIDKSSDAKAKKEDLNLTPLADNNMKGGATSAVISRSISNSDFDFNRVVSILETQLVQLKAYQHEERNRFMKEREEERNRNLKEREEERDRYMKEREREREEERSQSIRLEVTLQEKNKMFEKKEKEYIEKINKLKLKLEEKDRASVEKINRLEIKIEEKDQLLNGKDELLKLALSPKNIYNNNDNNNSNKNNNKKKSKEEEESKGIKSPEEESTDNNNNDVNSVSINNSNSSDYHNSAPLIKEVPVNRFLLLSWLDLTWICVKLKIHSLLFGFFVALLTIAVVSIFMEQKFGVINLIAGATNANHFFVCIVSANMMIIIHYFFTFGKNLFDFYILTYNIVSCFWWIVTCTMCFLIFPYISGEHKENNQLVSPSTSVKALMFFMFFVADWMANILHKCFWFLFLEKILIKYRPSFLGLWLDGNIERQKKGARTIIIDVAIISSLSTCLNFSWFPFALLFGIGSVSLIPSLDANVEIFLFGYAMPVIKAVVISILYNHNIGKAEKYKWSAEKTAKNLSAACASGVMLCTLSSLYVIFRGANDYNFFIAQYVPHELLKKLSWLTYHPLFLQMKMETKHFLLSVYSSICCLFCGCKKRDKVNPASSTAASRRFSFEIVSILNPTASELVGRQFGEDWCMFLMSIWLLPISQEYIFGQIYLTSSSSLSFPSYNSIGAMIIGVAFGIETFSTVACFVALQRVGIPLANNTLVLEFDAMATGSKVCCVSAYLLVLAATFIY